MMREVTVALPPYIGTARIDLTSSSATRFEAAMREVAALDETSGASLQSLGALLLRTESVASSKIERVSASAADYARALHSSQSNAAAVSMVAATTAMDQLMRAVSASGSISLPDVIHAHHALMVDDPFERSYAGTVRDMQNWIGGSDYSPTDALYVPPPPDTVPAYLEDLLAFANRDDLPTLLQAAITHAQFESIHPFTDGNGRIGRVLINAVLRRRRVTTRVVIPVASALVARRDQYFDTLTAYRTGDLDPLLDTFTSATLIAAAESRVTAARLAAIPQEWFDQLGGVRRGSAASRLLDALAAHPIVTAAEAIALLGGRPAGVYAAIDRLHQAGVLRPLTTRVRDQIWGASAILDELDSLDARIGRAALRS